MGCPAGAVGGGHGAEVRRHCEEAEGRRGSPGLLCRDPMDRHGPAGLAM